MKIKSIYLKNLRVVELLTFLKHIYPVLILYPAASAKLKRLVEELAKTMVELSASQNRGSFEGETQSIKQANKNRTESLKLFCKYVDAFSHSDNPTVKEQAILLLTAIKKEKSNLSGSSQKGQTGGVDGLNTLFTTNSRYSDALLALSAKPFWDKVMVEDGNYDGKYSNRTEVMASEEGTDSASEVSKRVRVACTAVFELVEDLYNVEEKPEYLDMITKINIEIDATMATIHARETLAAKAKEEEQNKPEDE